MTTARSATVEAVVCIPTFRRPEGLRRTLASLAEQRTSRAFAVVVAENDAGGAGAAVAREFFATAPLPGTVTVEAVQGNCSAINAAFSTALAAYTSSRFLLMIDDDEVAAPDWLERMVAAAEASGADVVGGPVFPSLPDGARPGLAAHPAFAPAYARSGPVPMIYGSGNCLIGRRVFARLGAPFFDPRYNFLGGGDTDFFSRAKRAGFAFRWVCDAEVREDVPPARTQPGWLAARGLRIGAINYSIERRGADTAMRRAGVALKNLAVLGLALPRGLRLIARTGEPTIALHPLYVGLGRLLASLGVETQQYRAGTGPRTLPGTAPAR